MKFVQQNEPPDSPGAGTYSPVAWAPDGSRLLIHRAFYTTSGTLQINAIAYDNIVYLGTGCCHPSWTPDGRYIYVSGPYYWVRVETGLHRYDTFGDATEETLIGSDLSGDTVPLVDDARVLADGKLYSFQRTISKAEYSQMNGLADFFMVRSALDGVSDIEQLRPTSYKIMNVLWADDGSGALVAEQPQGSETDVPIQWLPALDAPATELPVRMPVLSDELMHWGPTAETMSLEGLRQQFSGRHRHHISERG